MGCGPVAIAMTDEPPHSGPTVSAWLRRRLASSIWLFGQPKRAYCEKIVVSGRAHVQVRFVAISGETVVNVARPRFGQQRANTVFCRISSGKGLATSCQTSVPRGQSGVSRRRSGLDRPASPSALDLPVSTAVEENVAGLNLSLMLPIIIGGKYLRTYSSAPSSNHHICLPKGGYRFGKGSHDLNHRR
jgi:hypothetical protein